MQFHKFKHQVINGILSPIKNASHSTANTISDFLIDYNNKSFIDITLSSIQDEVENLIYKTLLENTLSHIKYVNQPGKPTHPHHEYLLPIVKNTIDKISDIRNLIGVQPMIGSVGLVYTLQLCELEDGKLKLEIINSTTTAGTRQLQTRYNHEFTTNALSFHKLSIKDELANIISTAVADEITAEIINNLISIATPSEFTSPIPKTEEFTPEIADRFSLDINRAVHFIASHTRRGHGNWVVANPELLTMLIAANKLKVEPNQDDKMQTLRYVGMLGETTIKVYCYLYFPDDVKALVGYKGQGEIDTGYIYSPYMLCMSGGMVVDPNTFEPIIPFMTRYGTWTAKNASAYYVVMT